MKATVAAKFAVYSGLELKGHIAETNIGVVAAAGSDIADIARLDKDMMALLNKEE
jgi:hypothetical protein